MPTTHQQKHREQNPSTTTEFLTRFADFLEDELQTAEMAFCAQGLLEVLDEGASSSTTTTAKLSFQCEREERVWETSQTRNKSRKALGSSFTNGKDKVGEAELQELMKVKPLRRVGVWLERRPCVDFEGREQPRSGTIFERRFLE